MYLNTLLHSMQHIRMLNKRVALNTVSRIFILNPPECGRNNMKMSFGSRVPHLPCTHWNFPNWWEAYPVLGAIDLRFGFRGSLFFDAELFNSFLAQLAWLPAEKSTDLNGATESAWTCNNLRPISELTPNFCWSCLHAPVPAFPHTLASQRLTKAFVTG